MLLRPPPRQRHTRGGDLIEAHPGDVIQTPPGEEHWHGAGPDRFMIHLGPRFRTGTRP